jgi:hypothetical protein
MEGDKGDVEDAPQELDGFRVLIVSNSTVHDRTVDDSPAGRANSAGSVKVTAVRHAVLCG